jgi:hypothetical protein
MQKLQKALQLKAAVSCRGIEDEAHKRNKGSFAAVCAKLTLRHDTPWLVGSRKARNLKNRFLAT